MAPEQARGEGGLSTAVDTYSLGAVLYECLTGRPPFRAATPLDTVLELLEREPAQPRSLNPEADRDLATICLKCLEKEPGRRYGSAEALAEDLERWQRGEPIQARPARPWERVRKWGRRQPALAALVLVSSLAALSLFVGGLWHNTRLRAALAETTLAKEGVENQRDQTRRAKEDVERQRDKARQNLYFAYMNLAQAAWEKRDPGRVLALLDAFRIATGENDLRGWEWHYQKRRCQEDLRTLTGLDAVCVAFSPDGKRVSASDYSNVKVWDASSGREITTFRGRGCHAFSPDGKRIAACSQDPLVRIWDAASGRQVLALEGHSGIVQEGGV